MNCKFLLLFISFSVACHGYHVFEEDCMGTKFIVLIDEDDKKKAKEGAFAAFKEGQRLNMVLSDYESASELFRFSESFLSIQNIVETLRKSPANMALWPNYSR